MKRRNQIAITTSLILGSGVAWGHPGHEAIGDALHVEYLFVATIVAVSTAGVLKKIKQRR